MQIKPDPETPVVLEEALIKLGWRVNFKDFDVCVLDNPKDPKGRPVCIPQKVDHTGKLARDIVEQILFDAKLDIVNYLPLRKTVIEALAKPL
jgi:hypothetical protein